MLNLYEILEVNEKASQEVIEKAYRVLTKKYHPDLQKENKQEAEKKMKEINEAYEILGNEQKRKQYDEELLQKRKEEQRQKEEQIRQEIQNEMQSYNINQEPPETNLGQQNNEYISYGNDDNLQSERDKAYKQAYYDYLRSLRL